jgi:hypothetical protein
MSYTLKQSGFEGIQNVGRHVVMISIEALRAHGRSKHLAIPDEHRLKSDTIACIIAIKILFGPYLTTANDDTRT